MVDQVDTPVRTSVEVVVVVIIVVAAATGPEGRRPRLAMAGTAVMGISITGSRHGPSRPMWRWGPETSRLRSGRPLSSPMPDSMPSLKMITKVAWIRHQIITTFVCHICDSSFETDDTQDIFFD
ncbi:hypothetical protein [Luteimonas panaciterrae]|uniref:hypothetical protein n=1 Tax=Luteimonas panaciterrae TaxID=363885 RepID=UPI001CFA6617|nr:hypothetical protein [Luteimonas panaciterrae]